MGGVYSTVYKPPFQKILGVSCTSLQDASAGTNTSLQEIVPVNLFSLQELNFARSFACALFWRSTKLQTAMHILQIATTQ
jgi:hypothetical protein